MKNNRGKEKDTGSENKEENEKFRLQKITDELEKERISDLEGIRDKIQLVGWFKEKLRIKIDIEDTWRIGKNKSKLVVKCERTEEKVMIMNLNLGF